MPLPTNVANELDAITGEVDPVFKPTGEGYHAKLHNDANEEINEIKAELGTNPSGAEADVAARLAAMNLVLATHTEGLSTAAAAIAAEAARAEAAEASKAALVHTHPQYDPFDSLPYIVPMGYPAGTTGTLTAKRGYFNRFTVAKKREFKFIRFGVAVTGGGAEDKFDGVIYKLNGSKFERLASAGYVKINMTSLGPKAIEMTSVAVCEPGQVYYVGFQPEAVTGTPQVVAVISNNANVGDIAGTGTLGNRLFLIRTESGAFPSTLEGGFSGSQNPWLVPSEV